MGRRRFDGHGCLIGLIRPFPAQDSRSLRCLSPIIQSFVVAPLYSPTRKATPNHTPLSPHIPPDAIHTRLSYTSLFCLYMRCLCCPFSCSSLGWGFSIVYRVSFLDARLPPCFLVLAYSASCCRPCLFILSSFPAYRPAIQYLPIVCRLCDFYTLTTLLFRFTLFSCSFLYYASHRMVGLCWEGLSDRAPASSDAQLCYPSGSLWLR